MGQKKGNPTPSYQNQAYEVLRPNTNARENRDMGTKPVMIDDNTTLNDYVDLTFDTDAVAAMVSASLNTTIYAVSSSIDTRLNAVSQSLSSQLISITSSAWTPTITGDAALFSNAINKKSGFYQKIGNVVQFTLHAEFQNPTASLISAGNFQFNLPVTPTNNWSGSWGLVNGTTNIHSNNTGASSTMYVVNGTKLVYFDGNRGGTSNSPIYVHVNGQYTIDN